MKTLTAYAKQRITEDWHSRFPSLSVYKPMWLMRRVGPLLVGICLNRDSGNDNYKPLSHVDCLCSIPYEDGRRVPKDFISLTLKHQPLKPLKNGRTGLMYARVREHETIWRELADLLEQQAYVPLEGGLTIERVLKGYRTYLSRPNTMKFPHCYEDMALMLAWAGRHGEAMDVITAACEEMSSWPVGALDRYGGLDQWEQQVTEAASDRAALQATAENQIHDLGLELVASEGFA